MKSKYTVALALCATLLAGPFTSTVIAWGATDVPTGPPATAASAGTGGDAALQVSVSFEAKRQPVGELLLDLQKQGGVHLSGAPGSRAAAGQVTARVKALSLQVVMNSLARLYGGTWTKTADNAYTLDNANLSDVEVNLLQLGNVDELNSRLGYAQYKLRQQRPSWPSLILPQVDGVALRSRQGVPLSDVDEQTRRALQEDYAEPSALAMLQSYAQAVSLVLEQGTLSIKTPRPIGNMSVIPFPIASLWLPHQMSVPIVTFGVPHAPDAEDLLPGQKAAPLRPAWTDAAQQGATSPKE